MPDVSVGIDIEHSHLDRSPITIGDVAGGYISKNESISQAELEQLKLRVRELEQFVFGDEKLGTLGIRQQLQGWRFWVLFNWLLTALLIGVLIGYEIFRMA